MGKNLFSKLYKFCERNLCNLPTFKNSAPYDPERAAKKINRKRWELPPTVRKSDLENIKSRCGTDDCIPLTAFTFKKFAVTAIYTL